MSFTLAAGFSAPATFRSTAFTNGAADAVDTGTLGGQSVEALHTAAARLTELADRGETDVALQRLDEADSGAPAIDSGHQRLVDGERERRGDLAGALEAVTRAAELEPGAVHARLRRSQLLARSGDIEAAVQDARRAAELQPQNAGLHGHLSRMLTQKGQLDAAEAAIREAIAAAPDTAPFHAHLSFLLQRRGDVGGALAALSRATELDPESAQLRQRLDRLRAQQDR